MRPNKTKKWPVPGHFLWTNFIYKICMEGIIRRQFRVKGCGKQAPLAAGHNIPVDFQQDFHVGTGALHIGRPDEYQWDGGRGDFGEVYRGGKASN